MELRRGAMAMRIAVTGTPGVGKTTLCARLGDVTHSIAALAATHGLVGPVEADGAAPVDIEALAALDLPAGIYDGHLSHMLPVDAIVLLRCHPETLEARLCERGYGAAKVAENVEAELIGLILAECMASGLPLLELDASDAVSTADVEAWFAGGFKPPRPSAPIDWIEILHGGA